MTKARRQTRFLLCIITIVSFMVLVAGLPSSAVESSEIKQKTQGIDLPNRWSLYFRPTKQIKPGNSFFDLFSASSSLVTLRFNDAGRANGTLTSDSRLPSATAAQSQSVTASFKDMQLSLNIIRREDRLFLSGQYDPFSERIHGTFRNQNQDELGTFDMIRPSFGSFRPQTFPQSWALRIENDPWINWQVEFLEDNGRLYGRVKGRRSDQTIFHYAHIEGVIQQKKFSGTFKDDTGIHKISGQLNGFNSAIEGTIDSPGLKVPFRMHTNLRLTNSTAETTDWDMDYVPALEGARVTIRPSMQIRRMGNEVIGTATYRSGWCGNDLPARVHLYGTWVNNDVHLNWVISGNPYSRVLIGKFNRADGSIRGTVKAYPQDMKSCNFILRPATANRSRSVWY